MLVYATPEDLATWTKQTAPEGAAQLLRSASGMVRHATRTALYDTTPAGLPSDPDVADAMRDATCAQAAAWAALGVDPATGPAGVAGQVQSSSILSADVTYAAREGADADKVATLTALVPDAVMVLEQAGLLAGAPVVY